MKSKFKVDRLLTKVFAVTFPYMVLYLLSAWILADWNILLYSDIEKVIIVLVALWQIPVAISGCKRDIIDLICILSGVAIIVLYIYLCCIILTKSFDMSSLPIIQKIVIAIIVEVTTMVYYLICEADVIK